MQLCISWPAPINLYNAPNTQAWISEAEAIHNSPTLFRQPKTVQRPCLQCFLIIVFNRWWPLTVQQMGDGWNSSVGTPCDDDVIDSSDEADLCIRVKGLAGVACVSLQLLPRFYASAQLSPTLGQCPLPIQANPHPGPPDFCSGISYG